MGGYDPQMVVRNIYHLAKEKGVRICEIEDAAQVGRGTLSRMKKHGVRPTLQFAVAAANTLEVSVDDLVREELAAQELDGSGSVVSKP